MREMDFFKKLDAIVLSHAIARGGPFAHAIEGENRCFLKRGGEKRRSGVRLMVFGEKNLSLISNFPCYKLFNPNLLLDPEGDRLKERRDAPRRISHIGLE